MEDLLNKTVELLLEYKWRPSKTQAKQFAQQMQEIDEFCAENGIEQVDFIQSDMAPNTIGDKETDAIRSIGLLEQTLRVYDKYLKPDGKFCTKIFMGP